MSSSRKIVVIVMLAVVGVLSFFLMMSNYVRTYKSAIVIEQIELDRMFEETSLTSAVSAVDSMMKITENGDVTHVGEALPDSMRFPVSTLNEDIDNTTYPPLSL